METTLVVIPLAALLAPVLARALGDWVRIPVVVFELVLGIVFGPSVLGWAHPTSFVDHLSEFGLAMLFFVAGTEMDVAALGVRGPSGRTGRRAILGWLISLVAGTIVGFLVKGGEGAIIIGIALASTALGTLLPILRDAGELATPFGRAVGAVGAVGEFGPLVAISIFLGVRRPGAATIVLAAFLLLAAGAVAYASLAPHGALHSAVRATMHTSGQFAIRAVLLILAGLVALSMSLGIDMLLGAFAAGLTWRLLIREADESDREAVESKIEAIAFGFLVPIFFIYTGVTFDLDSLLDDPRLLLLVVAVLIALLITRGLPSTLAAPAGVGRTDRMSLLLLGATGLPIIVAVTSTGVQEKLLSSSDAAVLVGGGMLSVLVFPLVAMSIRGEKEYETNLADDQV